MNKRMKKKKYSSKRKVRILERVNKSLRDALEFQKEQIRRQHRIIRALGSKDGYEFLDRVGEITIETEEIKAEQYGNYTVICEDLTNEIIDSCENELITAIVKGLIDNNAVQFIVKDRTETGGMFERYSTVAAKISVVPWHEKVKSKDEADLTYTKLHGV